MDPSHCRIYHQARCYDVAFSFRDTSAECDTLAALASRHRCRPVTAVLELAAGPACHAREFARRGAVVTALDLSSAMCEYALEQAARDGVNLRAVAADMCDFELGQRFDLAVLLMDSSSYLLDNDAVLNHLGCVARHLVDGGLYVLEMTHPRAAFGVGKSANTNWTADADGLRVTTQWGAEGDAFDPIAQVDEVTVTMEWSGQEGSGRLVERARQRRFTANEVDALVRASGHFDIVEWLGSLAPAAPFDNDRAAWRMVPVLRKRVSAAPTTTDQRQGTTNPERGK
jgi:SAM-dependent methyltransferase